MRDPVRRQMPARPKKNLGFLTEEELDAPCEAVTIRVVGEYYKRGEHRQDVYEEQYEADIVVPKMYNMGHVKLMVNRHVKDIKSGMNGIRVRTFNVDASVAPKPYTEKKYRVRDFMSDMGLQENKLARESHMKKLERKRIQREMEEDPNYVPPIGSVDVQSRVSEDHNYSIGGD